MKVKVRDIDGSSRKWREVEVHFVGMGIVNEAGTDQYYPSAYWKAKGIKVASHERWFYGEAMRIGDVNTEYRFGGYTTKGWIIALTMAMGQTGIVCQPELARRP